MGSNKLTKTFDIEVAYAELKEQYILPIKVTIGTTVKQAIEQSCILETCPQIDLAKQAVGIFGKVTSLEYTVADGDRIEIYRELHQNPMEARHRKAKAKPKSKSKS